MLKIHLILVVLGNEEVPILAFNSHLIVSPLGQIIGMSVDHLGFQQVTQYYQTCVYIDDWPLG